MPEGDHIIAPLQAPPREYAKVGKEEVDMEIELTQEILKADYQSSTLLSKPRALKKP